MTNQINNAVEDIVTYKSNLMKGSSGYRKHRLEILKKLNIKNLEDAFIVGAVDAMIYDVACSLDFTKKKGKREDWSSYKKREEILIKIW